MPKRGAGLVLVGMPTSGKTTVGRIVAQRLGRRFIDTDELVERRIGMAVPDYLARYGEPAFREHEAAIVAEAVAHEGAVIGAGGGAVLDPLNRWALWRHGPVAWLDAPRAVLATRLEADAVPRPTLMPYSAEHVAQVAAERAPAYRAADLRVDASSTPEAIAGDLLDQHAQGRSSSGWRLFDGKVPRHHPIGPTTTRIVLGVDLDRATITGALPAGDASAVIDRRVMRQQQGLVAGLPTSRCLAIAGGERTKRIRQLERILEWLATNGAEREAPLIAVGGGTIGDLAGTAAALYARGVPLVHVPTTWLAQADSAIGGKVAVDLAHAKNAVGAFWPPAAVIGEVGALRTQTPRARREGMAECIKAAMIGDPALWRVLETRGRSSLRTDEAARFAIIERAARLKLAVCERDPFEIGERRTLNLGHTIGHALEIESGYRLSHGAAVVLGLRAVTAIAAGRGADRDLAGRLDALLADLGYAPRHRFDPERVRSAMRTDKKRSAGRQRWILPMRIGHVLEVDDVTDAELTAALGAIAA
jgi:shikimate kinase / 3-dehydroquinate synthase